MKQRKPFHYLEPSFFAGLLDDPLLLINIRPLGRSILFDCGQIHHFAKRVVKSLDAIFISHTHMDHFMGLDTIIRNVHVSPRTIHLYGPPGIARKTENKLAGYEWNLTEPTWCSIVIHEIFPSSVKTFSCKGSEGFVCHCLEEIARHDSIIYQNNFLTVEAKICDHRIPALIFKITESAPFLIDEAKIDRYGLVKGTWMKMLKSLFYRNQLQGAALSVRRRTAEGMEKEETFDAAVLYESIKLEAQEASIGYITDVGFTDDNV